VKPLDVRLLLSTGAIQHAGRRARPATSLRVRLTRAVRAVLRVFGSPA